MESRVGITNSYETHIRTIRISQICNEFVIRTALKKDIERYFAYQHSDLGLIRAFYYSLDSLDKTPWCLEINGALTCYAKCSDVTKILNRLNFC